MYTDNHSTYHTDNTQSHPLDHVYQHQQDNKPSGEGFLNALLEIIIYVVVILVSVVVIRYFFIAPFSVDGSSMEPNLHHNELIIINKIGYSEWFGFKFGQPKRGDIVVVIPPNDTSKFYVKRIVALPNENIEFVSGEIVIHNEEYPNGSRLSEKYLSDDNSSTNPPGGYRNKTVNLSEREYYILGDNRSHSHDSRKFGPINQANIVGKVWVVVWPFPHLRVLEDYIYSLLRIF